MNLTFSEKMKMAACCVEEMDFWFWQIQMIKDRHTEVANTWEVHDRK
jgi:hypothetical protein